MIQGLDREQLDILKEGAPGEIISQRTKGGKTYSYVEVMYITDTLNKLFGYLWSWDLVDEEVLDSGIVDQKSGQNKKYVRIKGILSVPMIDPNDHSKYIWIRRSSYGIHALNGGDMEIRGAAFKAASSDGLKKAASTLGIAKNVYMSEELLGYLENNEDTDEWTEETMKEYATEINRMKEFSAAHPDKQYFFRQFCEETKNYTKYMEITPSNIRAFLSWYDNFEAQEKAKAEEIVKTEQAAKVSVQTNPLRPY